MENKPEISYDDFTRLDLRVGTVRVAERVPESDKLLRLEIELESENRRQIIAGLGRAYNPADLVDRQVVVIANLAPRQLLGLESRGMVLAADGPTGPIVLTPAGEVTAGTIIK
jgi:methionyl-tRNA synthetase